MWWNRKYLIIINECNALGCCRKVHRGDARTTTRWLASRGTYYCSWTLWTVNGATRCIRDSRCSRGAVRQLACCRATSHWTRPTPASWTTWSPNGSTITSRASIYGSDSSIRSTRRPDRLVTACSNGFCRFSEWVWPNA